MNVGRVGSSGCGNVDDALSMGGATAGYLSTVEK